MRKRSFAPLINTSSSILILGTMPGEESLRQQQYYAHPRNQFWRILYHLFNAEMDSDYQKKTAFILSKQIALWDVVASCARKGSLDANIQAVVPNDFQQLFKQHPGIGALCFNGQRAYHLYRKHVGKVIEMPFYVLESTSPANTKSLEAKMEKWCVIPTLLT